jgi:ER lumen protein retaining receptor
MAWRKTCRFRFLSVYRRVQGTYLGGFLVTGRAAQREIDASRDQSGFFFLMNRSDSIYCCISSHAHLLLSCSLLYPRYNSVMKVIFLASSARIVYYMRFDKVVSQTYDRPQDTFRYIFLIAPAALLALVIPSARTPTEIAWTFSIYLEAVAILPQLVLMQRTQNIDNLTGNYVFLLGTYRGLYMLNWIYRYFTEPHYRQWIAWTSGFIQTLLYVDFFYYYLLCWKSNKRLQLPA